MKTQLRGNRWWMALWTALCLPCVLTAFCCGCGTLRNDKAPPVAKQVLYGVDAIGTGVAVVTSPVWFPVLAIAYDNKARKESAAHAGQPPAGRPWSDKGRKQPPSGPAASEHPR